jgi:hypothetical protein
MQPSQPILVVQHGSQDVPIVKYEPLFRQMLFHLTTEVISLGVLSRYKWQLSTYRHG